MIASFLALLLALPVTLLLGIYTLEVIAGLRPDAAGATDAVACPRTTVLMPAHNEAAGIGRTLAALSVPPNAPIEILVVADNCTDDTAQRARAAGATVVERHDPERRGKGYALAFGRDALAAAPPACVVVLDADCTIAGDGLVRLARHCAATERPVQSCYLLRGNTAAPIMEQVSNFAFLVKNLVRQRGMARLGQVAALTGSGMALPWAAFCAAPLANGDIVEDLALGVWLTRQGWVPRFLSSARTWSDGASGQDLLVQRSRWEHGFIATARRRALPLVGAGLARGRRELLWLGLHLLVPPLALLFAIGGVVLLATAAAAGLGASWWPAALVAAALTGATFATLAAWSTAGRDVIAARTLLQIPRYIAAKLPIYGQLFGGGRSGWVRTRRADEVDDRPL